MREQNWSMIKLVSLKELKEKYKTWIENKAQKVNKEIVKLGESSKERKIHKE